MLTLVNSGLLFPCRKIKVWDLQAALDPRAPASTLCLRTLVVCDLLEWGPGKLVSYTMLSVIKK